MFRGLFRWLWSRQNQRAFPKRALGTVRQGKRYRATVVLSWGESLVATNAMIKEQLVDAGFTEVTVSGSGYTRIAEALWPGKDTSAELDPHLQDITELA